MGPLFAYKYSGRGRYSQATPGLLNMCVTVTSLLVRLQFFYLLGLENQLSARCAFGYIVDLHSRIAPIFDGELDISSVWK